MELRRTIYWDEKNKTEKSVSEYIKKLLKEEGLNKDEILWIVNTDVEIKLAKKYNIATIGYLDKTITGQSLWGTEYVVERLEDIDEEFKDKVFRRHHHLPWTIATTERCIIREFAMTDLDALFELYSKPGITDYVEPLFDYKEEAEYELAYINNMYRYFGYGMWVVFDRFTGRLIGRAGLEHREYENDEGNELEMGYLFDVEYQHKGYATEVCREIIKFAAINTEFDTINCLIHPANAPSIRLVKRLGFDFVENTEITGEIMARYALKTLQFREK